MLPGPIVQSRHTQCRGKAPGPIRQPSHRDGPRIELQGRSNK
ncbi:hypothetical protein [Pseudomonas phage BL1]|nr:hypothetical protein [Pseudomonas phage BL1]